MRPGSAAPQPADDPAAAFPGGLILALARPFPGRKAPGGEAAILILDTSASMAATDVAPSRLESAKQRARQLVDDLPDSARVTIIEAGREARVLLSSSLDRRQAHLAIQSARRDRRQRYGVALELASAIAARQPGTEIIVLSDGRVDLPDRLTISAAACATSPLGLNGENQAISLLTLETAPGGSRLTAFARLATTASSRPRAACRYTPMAAVQRV
jgi:Ca-activated chloride channel homolog